MEYTNDVKKYKIVDYPGVPANRYLISEYGDLFDTLNCRFIKTYQDEDGYFKCTISKHNIFIHRLVAWAFHPNTRDMSLVIDHIDANKQNNYYKNLEWVTIKENTRRAEKLGLRKHRKDNSPINQWPESLVHDICRLMEQGNDNMTVYREIFKKEKLDMCDIEDKRRYELIHALRQKKAWPDITSQYTYPTNSNSKKLFTPKDGNIFTEDQIHQICKHYVNGMNNILIGERMGLDQNDPDYKKKLNVIRSITLGRNWTYISSQYFDSRFHECNRSTYEFDDALLSRLCQQNYSNEYILREFGITPETDDKLRRRALVRRIHNYRKNAKIPRDENLELTDDDLNAWAAEW